MEDNFESQLSEMLLPKKKKKKRIPLVLLELCNLPKIIVYFYQ